MLTTIYVLYKSIYIHILLCIFVILPPLTPERATPPSSQSSSKVLTTTYIHDEYEFIYEIYIQIYICIILIYIAARHKSVLYTRR